MQLESLRPNRGATKTRKRVGRGPGSGLERTAGKGEKGQKSRSGYAGRAGFEGGQMPLQRRMPKRGFKNPFRRERACINVSDLARRFATGQTVDPAELRAKGLVKNLDNGVKVLGNGDLAVALVVRAHAFSATAIDKIEKAGGKCEVIEG